MIINFKNNKKKYFYFPILKGMIIDVLLIIIFFLYKKNIDIGVLKHMLITAFLFSLFLYKIPLLIILINYLKYSESKDFYIIKEENKIIFKFPKKKEDFFYSDIKNIETYLPIPKYEKRMTWLFWDNCFYYKIILKNNKSYYITCLNCDNLFDFIPDEKNIRKKWLFPIIIPCCRSNA